MQLTSLVDPTRSGAVALAAGLVPGRAVTAEHAVASVAHRLTEWAFLSRPGSAPPDQVDRRRAGNCIDLASLLCSTLRRLEVPGSHVVLGSWPGAFPALMHAWTAAYDPGSGWWLLVDPRDMVPRRVQAADIERELVVTALFDDARVVMPSTERALYRSTVEDVERLAWRAP